MILEKGSKVYLYGAGHVLERSRKFLEENFIIMDIIDKKYNAGKKKLPPIDSIIIITCIWVSDIEKTLRSKGFYNIYNIFSLYQDEMFRFHPPIDDNNMINVNKVKGFLNDQKSIDILESIVKKRSRGICDYSDLYEDRQYFPLDLTFSKGDAVFVDSGAFNGDTLLDVKKFTNDNFDKYYAIEPDSQNLEELNKQYGNDSRVVICPYASSDKEEILYFETGESASSFESNQGSNPIQAKKIDTIVNGEKVDFLKMDVEGAELKSLIGAKGTITKWKPDLAICIYHKPNDLWEIPFYVKNLVPEYKLYIRHHHKAWFETVLYATVKDF